MSQASLRLLRDSLRESATVASSEEVEFHREVFAMFVDSTGKTSGRAYEQWSAEMSLTMALPTFEQLRNLYGGERKLWTEVKSRLQTGESRADTSALRLVASSPAFSEEELLAAVELWWRSTDADVPRMDAFMAWCLEQVDPPLRVPRTRRPIYDLFGSWPDLVRAAGLTPAVVGVGQRSPEYTPGEIAQWLHAAAAELGYVDEPIYVRRRKQQESERPGVRIPSAGTVGGQLGGGSFVRALVDLGLAEPTRGRSKVGGPRFDERQALELGLEALDELGPDMTAEQMDAWARRRRVPHGGARNVVPARQTLERLFGQDEDGKYRWTRARAHLIAERDRRRSRRAA